VKVLVVEDEPASLKLAHLVLTAEGYEVAQAEAAAEAIEEIVRCEPDVILLDLELPGVDGLTLARNLKRNPATRHIAIVAITAFPERYSRERALADGCDGFIVKPMNTRKLPQEVAAAFRKAK
jgi:CheY-like chemotaxis protein